MPRVAFVLECHLRRRPPLTPAEVGYITIHTVKFRGLLYCNASLPGEGPSSRSVSITTDALCLKVSTKLGFGGGGQVAAFA